MGTAMDAIPHSPASGYPETPLSRVYSIFEVHKEVNTRLDMLGEQEYGILCGHACVSGRIERNATTLISVTAWSK